MPTCLLCSRAPCVCGATTPPVTPIQIRNFIEAAPDVPALLHQILPEGVDAEKLLRHPGVIMQLFTDEGSPFKLDGAQLIEFTGRLHALAVTAADRPASLETFLDAVHQDMSDPAMRIDRALDTILSYSLDLDESDPAIKDHRAWIIDRVLRRLTGDRYQTLRAYVHSYNEGIEPPDRPNAASEPD